MAKLAPYRAKRDFTRTSEPAGKTARRKGSSFVVQKHDASHLHYDFRLEMDGVLKSWAVAKGPSLVKGEKRLAVHVEDHPLAYADFEGTIPEGQYGGGTVLVWDRGTWKPEGDPHEGYEKGRLTFRLDGEKLNGTWHLVRMAKRSREKQESWLLIKAEDAYARTEDDPDILEEAPLSVKSSRSIEEIAPMKSAAKKKSVAKKPATSSAKKPASRSKSTTKEAEAHTVEVEGVRLTHPERVLWEDQGLTKQELAEFYAGIADWLLPHLVNRPLTLIRCPSGAQKKCFVQRHSWAGMNDAIHRTMVPDTSGKLEVLTVSDIQGVVALVQSGVLELHVWGATLADLEKPDRLIFDLDPGEGVEWSQVIEGALAVRERLKAQGLESFVKTTGGKGLHIVVPLKPKASWKEALAFTRSLAEAMAKDEPDRYTTTSVKNERVGKIFIDYLRNNREASAVAPYSTRSRPGAPVATPVAWEELTSDLKPNGFTVENLAKRLASMKQDPWSEIAETDQALPEAKRTRRTPRKA
ncbi:bifunctional non-homologous end joining protein LigD [Microvirga guangxiensis]|uniref:Bifunctional non-homologous end joining protein LigD n=2 Tax=Microvirga guangxiensis TaxID=549386 RepID=A0A1G5IAU2_9HYPH|nr:non-homologous end-joining DNA ligase [Microvirga guangxiensis]SCY73275.1 bifunctional non-homologous end joining protein LigD [Microvirga guangxiensis]